MLTFPYSEVARFYTIEDRGEAGCKPDPDGEGGRNGKTRWEIPGLNELSWLPERRSPERKAIDS